MIRVKTLAEFQKFLEIAKTKNIAYQILGSERKATGGTVVGMDPKVRGLNYTYVLCCQLFTIFIDEKIKIADAEKITAISSTFGFVPFAKIRLTESGTIECADI